MKIVMTIAIAIFILVLTLAVPCSNVWGHENNIKLSLDLEAVPLSMVLKLIADQNGLNIVVSGDVEGEISIRLDNVGLTTALDAILIPSGYNYYVKNDVFVIKPIDVETPDELETRIITLKYIEPSTAVKALKTCLSSKGKTVILDEVIDGVSSAIAPKANRIMITDMPSVFDKLIKLVEDLDQAERLVSIEVKIIETKVDNKSKIGFAWPTDITTSIGAGNQTISENSGAESNETTLENVTGSYNIESGRWTWGTLTVGQLTSILNLLNQQGNSKLISDPHITTLENHQAEIKVQTIIPIATVNRFSEGAVVQDIVTFQDEEIGISLKVTPRINGDGKLTLEVFSEIEDIIGFTGSSDNQKPITASRSIRTVVTVNNDETIALGGLLKEDEIIQEQKIPLLGQIPVLGRLLFTSKTTDKSTTDLIILITPRIMP